MSPREGQAIYVDLESDGLMDQSEFDFKWAGQKKKLVVLLEVLTIYVYGPDAVTLATPCNRRRVV